MNMGSDQAGVAPEQVSVGARAEELLEKILGRTSEGIAAFDHNWTYRYINPPGAAMLGSEPQQLIGRRLWDIFPSLAGGAFYQACERTVQQQLSSHVVSRWTDAGRWFDSRLYPSDMGICHFFSDVTGETEAQQELRRREQRFRATFDQAAVGIAHIALGGECIRVNRTLCRILQYDDELHLCRKHLSELLYGEDHEREVLIIRRLLEGEIDHAKVESRCVRRDGLPVWVELTFSLATEGEERYAIVVVQDISERKRLQEERDRLLLREKAAREHAEAASRAKDDLLAVVSHELRTPLTPVLLAVSSLEHEKNIPDELRDALNTIRTQIELEVRLINDLLDLTRITHGKIHLRELPVDAHAVLRRAVEAISTDAADKKLTLKLELQATQHVLRADPVRLQQVWQNLVQNSVKFTPPGGTITVRTLNPSPRVFQTRIIDTGIGIEPAMLQRLFRPFEQVEPSLTRRFGGLGLGLAISKALVDFQGGSITAHSEGKSKGTTFIVEFPAVHAPAEQPPRQSSKIKTSGRSLKLLVVEDNDVTLDLLARLLRRLGHQVGAARTMHEAMELAGRETYDLLISDIGLPDGSGWDLLSQLNQRQPIPGVALSGFASSEDIARSMKMGFAAHLVKPITVEGLQAVIEETVGR